MSFAFARGFLALGAFVGELRRLGGMVALASAPSAIPAAVLSLWGLPRGLSLAAVAVSDQGCRRRPLIQRSAAEYAYITLASDFTFGRYKELRVTY